jgi:hypothetical protein
MRQRKCIAPDCDVLFIPGQGYNKDQYCAPQCYRRVKARENRRKQGIIPARELRKTCLWSGCGEEFTPKNGTAETCSPEHVKLYANEKRRQGARITERESVIAKLCGHMGCLPTHFNAPDRDDFIMLYLLEWENGKGKRFEKFKTDNRWESTLALIEAAKRHIHEEGQMDVRHLHYMLVSDHILLGMTEPKPIYADEDGDKKVIIGMTEPEPIYYENTKPMYAGLTGKIAEARWRNDIGFDDIRDDLRESIWYSAWDSPEDFLEHLLPKYKIDLWANQEEIVEIWVEKNTIVGVIEDTCSRYRVPIRPFRGQASLSYAWDCAQAVRFNDKKLNIYYLGDHDATGYGIEKSMCERLTELLLDRCRWTPRDVMEKLHWERIGFLHDDFEDHNVQSLDADDKSEGSYHEWFLKMFPDKKAAEIEALSPREVRSRVKRAIKSHCDAARWKEARRKEVAERKSLIR